MIDANSPFLSVPVDGRPKGEDPRKPVEFSTFSLGEGASDGKPDSAAKVVFAKDSMETGPDTPNFVTGTAAMAAIDSATLPPSGDSIGGQLHSSGGSTLPVPGLENLKKADATPVVQITTYGVVAVQGSDRNIAAAIDALPPQGLQVLNGVGDAARIAPGQLPEHGPGLNIEGTDGRAVGIERIVAANGRALPNEKARGSTPRLAPYPPNAFAPLAKELRLPSAVAQERRGNAGDGLMERPPGAAKAASPPVERPLLQPSSSNPSRQPPSQTDTVADTQAASLAPAAIVLNDLGEGENFQKPSTTDILRLGYGGRSASTEPSGRAPTPQIRSGGRANQLPPAVAREANQAAPLAEQAPLAQTINKVKMTDAQNPLDVDGVVATQKMAAAAQVAPSIERKTLAANLETPGVAIEEKLLNKANTIDPKSARTRLEAISGEAGPAPVVLSRPTGPARKTVAGSPPTDQRVAVQVQGAVGQWVFQELERDNPNSKLFEPKGDGTFGGIENRVMTQSGLPIRGAPTQHSGAVPRAVQQIAQAASALADRPVELSLNPEELGRVRLTLRSKDGNLAVNIIAERPETLAFLRRHIDQLASQLREFGYQELTFEFADQRQQFANGEQRQTQQLPETVDDLSVPEMPGPTPVRIDLTPGPGVDIRL